METLTEIGTLLSRLHYKDDVVERFDKLAFFLYTIPLQERHELLCALCWQFIAIPSREVFEKFDKLYSDD